MNVYQEIADKVIAAIDKGEIMWHKPWVTEYACISGGSGKPYSLLNQLLLGARAGYYYTFGQLKAKNAKIKKGSKASSIYFFTSWTPKDKDADTDTDTDGSKAIQKRLVLKRYNVYHQDDIEGDIKRADPAEFDHSADESAAAEKIIADYVTREAIAFEHTDEGRAYYVPAKDKVVLPRKSSFAEISEYYSTAYHELSHSTMAKSRCDRPNAEGDTFASKGYAREELVAEISSAMLCRASNVDTDKAFDNSVAYLQAWRKVLTDDPAAIVWAASRAEKAAKYILG